MSKSCWEMPEKRPSARHWPKGSARVAPGSFLRLTAAAVFQTSLAQPVRRAPHREEAEGLGGLGEPGACSRRLGDAWERARDHDVDHDVDRDVEGGCARPPARWTARSRGRPLWVSVILPTKIGVITTI